MRNDSIWGLPLWVLIPWGLIVLLSFIAWGYMACEIADMNIQVKVIQHYKELKL
jgi:hypothetical protein